ncbi:membrane-associated guanylate kinase, WW and PDZ domain-containing protein 1-like [Ylistrum balloti]|uniref:membrane-associated guanylate kinase, WW and PDZ domain-containing protein 1-like n=1 Tax=Ylistrum balloti TaxID=509963 RepID=UPI002905B2BD|nr:membrane-associated guanylate kinase, WW and PDZ domain-containing protein 1-like [Ylistrum balloti]
MDCCSDPEKKRQKKIRAIETENWIHRFHSEYCWVKRLPQQIHRPLIPAKHQLDFDRLAPSPPGRGRRIINLRRRANESLGFAVRGGFEHGIGVFVSHIDAGSQAERQGLRVGDEIVRVNGYTISQAIHEEVLNLIKGHDAVELKVTNIGMLPVKEKQGDTLTWKYVEKRDRKKSVMKTQHRQEPEDKGEIVKLFANLRTSPSLGCRIISGPQGRGIYIQRVGPQSLGEQIGLEVGDQILDVNGISFLNVSHNEAIVALKSSKELNLVIRKKTGMQIVQSAAINTRTQTPTEPPKQESGPVSGQQYEEPAYAVVMKEKKDVPPPPPPPAAVPSLVPPPPPPIEQTTHRPKTKKKAPSPPSAPQPSLDFREELNRLNLKRQGEQKEMKDEDDDTLEGDDSLVEDHFIGKIKDQRSEEEQTPSTPLSTGNQDMEAAARLEKVLQQKQVHQRQNEERHREEVFERNRMKRNALEHKLLEEIRQHKRHTKKVQLELRLQRQQQDKAEMKREVEVCAVSDILRGIGRPLKKADLHLVGPTPGFSQPSKKEVLDQSADNTDSEERTELNSKSLSPISDIDDYVVEKKLNEQMDDPQVTDIDRLSLNEKLPYSIIH